MAGILVAALLVSSLLLVHFSMRSRPLDAKRPLDEDHGLPWPEAGQASTVFSLTALFGAYFGITLILGLPALLGLAFGTVSGLILTARLIKKRNQDSFEEFLQSVLKARGDNAIVFGVLLAGMQCCFAASELLILREMARAGLGLRGEDATLLAMALGAIGYFYVLFGGYKAVFRTDVLQFSMIALMGAVLLSLEFHNATRGSLVPPLWPRSGYWELPALAATGPLLYVFQFGVASVMGLGFLVASPDTWKRVFLVVKMRRQGPRFPMFVVVGTAPFLLLIPLAALTPAIADGPTDSGALFAGLISSDMLFVAAALGLVASFLSSFNSALLASVHVGLLLRRTASGVREEMSRFHWLMASALVSIGFVFLALSSNGNPYLLANALLGAYSVVAGVQVGTGWKISRLREGHLIWLAVPSLLAWFVYLTSLGGLTDAPNTYQLNTVPVAALLSLVLAATCRGLVTWSTR